MVNQTFSIEESERLNKQLRHLNIVREVFIFIGLFLIIIAFAAIAISLGHVDAHSAWFIPVCFGALAATLTGISLIAAGASIYKERVKRLKAIIKDHREIQPLYLD